MAGRSLPAATEMIATQFATGAPREHCHGRHLQPCRDLLSLPHFWTSIPRTALRLRHPLRPRRPHHESATRLRLLTGGGPSSDAYRRAIEHYPADRLSRPLNAIERPEVETRSALLTREHGWGDRHQVISLLRSIYRRACVDHEGLRNPVDLWLAAGGRFNPIVRRVISSPAEALPYWQRGIEAVVKDPAIRSIFWVAMYSGMRRGEILTLRWERMDLARGVVHVPHTKTGTPLELPITRQLASILDWRRSETGGDGWVFPSSSSRSGHVVGAHPPLCPHLARGRQEVLVPRLPQLPDHHRRPRLDVSALADQAPGQPRPPHRRDRGLRGRLDHRPAPRPGPTHRRPHRPLDEGRTAYRRAMEPSDSAGKVTSGRR